MTLAGLLGEYCLLSFEHIVIDIGDMIAGTIGIMRFSMRDGKVGRKIYMQW